MPNDKIWFRALTEEKDCPKITINGIEHQTSLHYKQTIQFPVNSCKFIIPRNTNKIEFDDVEAIIPNKKIEKILVIGDTGCRTKGLYVQNCQKDWPFAKIADMAISHKPDLIIHLGDFFYREFCRSSECKNEPVGDNFHTWEAEFFTPTTNLLNIAPWVMVRGNHESCNRGGKGWTHFFDDRKSCYNYSKPYAFDISPDLRFIIADSAKHDLSQNDLKKINNLSQGKKSWLLTHRPLWANKEGKIEFYSAPEVLAPNVTTIFSGHIHLFQASRHNGKKQIIVGNSGSKLNKWPETDFTKKEFGFVILEKQPNKSWKLDLFNVKDKVIASDYIK
ncbi:MAG: metallophosphoesterase [Rickettsiaceae bacterium H1]|nr:metallophosphoesterase [Rickettsiaceae bacterium H1]